MAANPAVLSPKVEAFILRGERLGSASLAANLDRTRLAG
jgi:hypothetical protein